MKAVDIIKKIGSVQEIKDASSVASQGRLLNNMHVHLPPNFSAFENIEQVLDIAVDEGIKVLGVTNYYYHDVYDTFAALAKKNNIFPQFGLEVISQIDELQKAGFRINDPGNPGRMYICGKGITRFDKLDGRGKELMDFIRSSDAQRMKTMTEKVAAIFNENGVENSITDQDVIEMIAERHSCNKDTIGIQERHIAQAFQRMFFDKVAVEDRIAQLTKIYGTEPKSAADAEVGVQGEIRSYLMKAGKPAFVEEKFVSQPEAFELILALGGIPCYPTLADGSPVRCEYEESIEKLAENILNNNIHCAEFIPIRNKLDVLEDFVKGLRSKGILVVAGTEHNTLDLLPLDPKCVQGIELSDELKDIFWEGACVVAAHQFLTVQGECGFVDSDGNPNSDFNTAEERIQAFKVIGEAVIRKYLEKGE